MRIMKYPIECEFYVFFVRVFVTDVLTAQFISSTVIPLEIWDSPGNATPESIGIPIGQFRSLIFVIDIRVCLSHSSGYISMTTRAGSVQPTHHQTHGLCDSGLSIQPQYQHRGLCTQVRKATRRRQSRYVLFLEVLFSA